MGADLLIILIPYPDITEERSDKITEIIDGLTEEDFWDVYDDEENWLDNEKKCLKGIIKDFDNFECRRDTAIYYIDRKKYLITGGESWGDDPTVVYSDLVRIDNCQKLYDLLNSYANEDIVINRKNRDL